MLSGDERIASWIDGELDAQSAAELEARYASDADFAERVDRMRRVDRLVRAAVPLETPLPAELLARLGLTEREVPANVVSLADVRRKPDQRARAWRVPRLAGSNGARIAASVVLLLGIGLSVDSLLTNPWATDPAAYRTLGDAPSRHTGANAIVMFAPDLSRSKVQAIARSAGARLVAGPTESGAWKLAIPAERRAAALAELGRNPHVTLAEPIDGTTL